MNLGVDAFCQCVLPEELRPGIGLRPGGERRDLEDHLPVLFDALYGSVVALSRLGLHVVVDVGHHDDYSRPLDILTRVAEGLADRPAYFIGVRCPVDVVMRRRDAAEAGREDRYARSGPGGAVPDPCSAGSGRSTTPGSTTSRWTPRSSRLGSAQWRSGTAWTRDPRRPSRSWREGLDRADRCRPDGGRKRRGDRRVLLIDAANVIGSCPDGWWRDRPGAARKFLERLRSAVQAGRLHEPVVVVLEGKAREGAEPTVAGTTG